jgi:hypothetical protein
MEYKMLLYSEIENPNCEVRTPRLSPGEEVKNRHDVFLELKLLRWLIDFYIKG